MKQDLNLFEILQNPIVGAIAIHGFISGYYYISKNKTSKNLNPSLNQSFFVLPVIYNYKSMSSFKSSRELYTAITHTEHKNNIGKSIFMGLHETACKMSQQTFDALNLGLSKNIFKLDNDNLVISINDNYRTYDILKLIKANNKFLKEIRKSAFQLGNIFAKTDDKMLQITLDIRF